MRPARPWSEPQVQGRGRRWGSSAHLPFCMLSPRGSLWAGPALGPSAVPHASCTGMGPSSPTSHGKTLPVP